MKIALIHLYSNTPYGGEYTYAIHLQSGFLKLGHECDIISETKQDNNIKCVKMFHPAYIIRTGLFEEHEKQLLSIIK